MTTADQQVAQDPTTPSPIHLYGRDPGVRQAFDRLGFGHLVGDAEAIAREFHEFALKLLARVEHDGLALVNGLESLVESRNAILQHVNQGPATP